MSNKCQMLKDAIKDEKKAAQFYEKLEKKLSASNKAKVNEIRKEETVHRKELIEILGKSICNSQEVLAQKIETCAFCGQEFDVNKRDNSGYIDNKPICAPCRDDCGDYL